MIPADCYLSWCEYLKCFSIIVIISWMVFGCRSKAFLHSLVQVFIQPFLILMIALGRLMQCSPHEGLLPNPPDQSCSLGILLKWLLWSSAWSSSYSKVITTDRNNPIHVFFLTLQFCECGTRSMEEWKSEEQDMLKDYRPFSRMIWSAVLAFSWSCCFCDFGFLVFAELTLLRQWFLISHPLEDFQVEPSQPAQRMIFCPSGVAKIQPYHLSFWLSVSVF